MPDEVYKYQNKINKILGDKSSQYWILIKQWLTCAYTYEELDFECQKLFPTPEDAFLHTNFMISLKNRLKVPPNTTQTKSQKRRTRKPKKQPMFQPAEVHNYVPMKENNAKPILYPDGSVHVQTYASEELFLPDKCMVLGRLLIAAWENDIEEVNDTVADIIAQASQMFLKNILTAILTSNRGYRTYDGYFKHSVGKDVPDPFKRNSIEVNREPSVRMNPNFDKEEQFTALNTSCKTSGMKKQRVSVEQVYDVLKSNRSIIPNHSVYSLALGQASFELDNDKDEILNIVSNTNAYKKRRTDYNLF